MTVEKKVYTMEDNVKSISFGVKDLVKQLETLNACLSQLVSHLPQKDSDQKDFPLKFFSDTV